MESTSSNREIEMARKADRDLFFKALAAIACHLEAAAKEVREILGQPLRVMEKAEEDVRAAFPQDLAGLLSFEATEDGEVLIKPTGYLGAENFGKAAGIVRDQLAGVYISAGKDSHFKIPKKSEVTATSKPKQPTEPAEKTTPQYDPERIAWTQAEGPSGLYQRADKQESADYQLLAKDVEAHRGHLTRGGFYYWLFSDGETVGRKQAARKK